MSEFKLPRQLRRAFVNLSATVQVLIGEIVLSVEGLHAEANRKAQTELEAALRNKKATEKLAEQLRTFLDGAGGSLTADEVAYSIAAASGRSTREIANFFGAEQRYVMRRLCAAHKAAGTYSPPHEPHEDMTEGGEVLELFAEAQRR
jgi:hypothetical protein